MRKPGPPPKPRSLKLLEGNPGKRKLPRAVEPTGEPEMPTFLNAEARKEWARVLPQLRKLGLASSLDRAALAGYCQSWSRWVESESHLRRYGTIVRAPQHGFPMQSPYLAIANMAIKQMREFLIEFGMTPAARTRVEADEPPLPGPISTTGKDPARFFPDRDTRRTPS